MILVLLALSTPPMPPPPAGTPPDRHETRREPMSGGFSIEHETYSTSRPMMHVASAWEKVRLVWTSPDAKVQLTAEDTGETIELRAAVVATDSGRPCSASGPVTYYAKQPPTAQRWQSGFAAWRELIQGCGAPYHAALTAAKPAYLAAANDFVVADARLRAVAAQRFATISQRCVRQTFDRSTFMPGWRCTQVYDANLTGAAPRYVKLWF